MRPTAADLERISLFASLSDSEREELAESFEVRSKVAGTELIGERAGAARSSPSPMGRRAFRSTASRSPSSVPATVLERWHSLAMGDEPPAFRRPLRRPSTSCSARSSAASSKPIRLWWGKSKRRCVSASSGRLSSSSGRSGSSRNTGPRRDCLPPTCEDAGACSCTALGGELVQEELLTFEQEFTQAVAATMRQQSVVRR